MWYHICFSNLVKKYLPPEGQIIELEDSVKRPAIYLRDIDNDGIAEVIAAYKWKEKVYIMVLKNYYNSWHVVANIEGEGYNVNYLKVASITSKRSSEIVIGWQVGAIWAKLNIYKWMPYGFKNIADEDIYYSKIEVEDMPSKFGRDGKDEIALWRHDTGEAYKVDVYRWENGKLVRAEDVYPYYFKKVAEYYEEKIKEMPEAGFYWYYLADAQIKSGELKKALESIEIAMKLQYPYPSIEELTKLKEEVMSKSRNRVTKLYPASIKTVNGVKWGYIDEKGNFIIKPQFKYAGDFNENGIAIVEVDNLYGIINMKGEYILNPKYDTIDEFSEGRAVAIDSNGFNLIDEMGREVTDKPYNFIGSFQEGRALYADVDNAGNWIYGYLDRQGKEVIHAAYESASDFKDKKAIVKVKNGEYALIGLNGEVLKNYNGYSYVGNMGEGLLAFQKNDGDKFGFMYEDENVVIPPKYTGVEAFSGGRAVVNMSEDYINQYGLIDNKGNYVIDPKYNNINLLGENRVAVGIAIDKEKPYIGSKYAVADTDGNFLTGFIYYGISNYNKGLASAYDAKNTFFIDSTGKQVKRLPTVNGSGTLSFEGDLIKADVDFRISYLDENGKIIWTQNTIIPLQDGYRIREEKFKPNKDYLVYYPQIEGIKDKSVEADVNKKLKELSQVKDVPNDIQLDYTYLSDFSVEFFKKNLLVLEIIGYKYYFGAAHGMPSKDYPHIDLNSGKFYSLKDLFKKDSNYVKVLSDIIEKEIKNNKEYSYVWPDSYKGIKEDQPFYVDEDALYIYFNPYEIAPYAAGFPTFKIPYSEIMNIIDVNGDFWKSYN